MFSALKFVAAAVIVALFGGFLLAGVLTTQQDGEVLPAAVTGSPEPEATSGATEAPMTSVRTDILPGVALTVEEEEPGVYRVADDGRGPLAYPVDPEVPYDIVAGHDGGIYTFAPGHWYRLGSGPYRGTDTDKGFDRTIMDGLPSDVGVHPNGEIWAVFDSRLYLTPWRGGEVEEIGPLMIGPEPIEVTSDGTVWAVWYGYSTPWGSGRGVFGYDDGDGWTMVGEWPFDGLLRVSDQGEVWAVHHVGYGGFMIHRFVDGAWREEVFRDGPHAGVGVDGTFWHIGGDELVRFDGTGWTTFESPDWVPEVGAWALTEDGWVNGEEVAWTATSIIIFPSYWGEPHLAPDGSLWVSHQLARLGHGPVCDDGIDGVVHFDGETWSRFLQGRCVEAMDIAADGSVWVLAADEMVWVPVGDEGPVLAVDGAWDLYVITPEAVAAAE